MSAPQVTPYVVLSDVSEVLTTGDNMSAGRESALRNYILQASHALNEWCGRRFDEYVDTRYYTALSLNNGGDLNGYELYLDADLRSVTTLTNGDGTTINSSAYQLLPFNKDNKRSIRLKTNAGVAWGYGGNDPYGAISLAGLWGFGGQWVNDKTLNGDINASVTTVAVNAGHSIEVGHVLKVGSEYLYVSAVSTNDLTVTRAFNGSTADTHSNTDPVYYWQASDLVRQTVLFLVIWAGERFRARLSGEAYLADAGIPIAVGAVPDEVQKNVAILKRKRAVRAV